MSGRIGALDLQPGVEATLFTVLRGYITSATVSVVNRSNEVALISIRMCETTPTNADYLEYQTRVHPSGVLERSGIVVGGGQDIRVTSSIWGVSAVAWGITEEM